VEPLIVEAALNEIVPRAVHPHVPISPDEIARDACECADAGAAIVHFHARDPATGANRPDETKLYAAAMREIRARGCDMLFWPTYDGRNSLESDWRNLRALAEDPATHPELFVFFPSAANYGQWDERQKMFVADHVGYMTFAETQAFLQLCRKLRIKPVIGAKEPGHVRQAVFFLEKGLIDPPLTCHFLLSDVVLQGPAPGVEGFRMLLSQVPAGTPFHWFAHNYGASHHKLNALAAAMGGHVRTGVGDTKEAPKAELRIETNRQMVERMTQLGQTLGRSIATPNEARRILGIAAR
jgi:3-keto-5-aminohexanoate cleavage enzyme